MVVRTKYNYVVILNIIGGEKRGEYWCEYTQMLCDCCRYFGILATDKTTSMGLLGASLGNFNLFPEHRLHPQRRYILIVFEEGLR